jgi:hypothetical protein
MLSSYWLGCKCEVVSAHLDKWPLPTRTQRATHVGGSLVQSRQLATGEVRRWLSLSS